MGNLVLVVEDDEVIASLLSGLLESADYRIRHQADGEVALHSLLTEDEVPRLILLDLMMPKMDGLQFLQERVKYPKLSAIPVIVMSADSQIREKLKGSSAAGFVKKPFDIDEILNVVATTIRNASSS